MNESTTADHEYIWLEPECCAEDDTGRMWCQDPVFECDCGNQPTRYVRADKLVTAELLAEDNESAHKTSDGNRVLWQGRANNAEATIKAIGIECQKSIHTNSSFGIGIIVKLIDKHNAKT